MKLECSLRVGAHTPGESQDVSQHVNLRGELDVTEPHSDGLCSKHYVQSLAVPLFKSTWVYKPWILFPSPFIYLLAGDYAWKEETPTSWHL